MVPFFETQLANQTRPGKLKPNFLLTSSPTFQTLLANIFNKINFTLKLQ